MIIRKHKTCPWCWGTFKEEQEHDFEACKDQHKPQLDNERLYLKGRISFKEMCKRNDQLDKEMNV